MVGVSGGSQTYIYICTQLLQVAFIPAGLHILGGGAPGGPPGGGGGGGRGVQSLRAQNTYGYEYRCSAHIDTLIKEMECNQGIGRYESPQ